MRRPNRCLPENDAILKLTRWYIAHRRPVIVAWVAIAILTTVLAGVAGRQYSTNFSLPGTDTQRAFDLVKRDFRSASGDTDTIVFHVRSGTIDAPAVRDAVSSLLARVAHDPHVVGVISPYSTLGALQVAIDRRTAFATVTYAKPANLLAVNTGKPVLAQIDAVKLPGLEIAAGGQVIEQAEGLTIGPATMVGVIAALVILLLTFGSLVAAAMPLLTAGLGLITGVALIGLATHVTSMANVAPELALMIGLGVGIDYALFIVTRFRENYTVLVEQSAIPSEPRPSLTNICSVLPPARSARGGAPAPPTSSAPISRLSSEAATRSRLSSKAATRSRLSSKAATRSRASSKAATRSRASSKAATRSRLNSKAATRTRSGRRCACGARAAPAPCHGVRWSASPPSVRDGASPAPAHRSDGATVPARWSSTLALKRLQRI